MKNRHLAVLAVIILSFTFFSCKKSETTTPAGGDFKFVSLSAADTVLKVNALTTITANATGQGLTYKWTSKYGTFIGSGSSVQWTVCHCDKFTVTCEVTNNANHSECRDVSIRTEN